MLDFVQQYIPNTRNNVLLRTAAVHDANCKTHTRQHELYHSGQELISQSIVTRSVNCPMCEIVEGQ